jgi:1-deoxy-D-xylulose-5-phosphate reductoisomerase
MRWPARAPNAAPAKAPSSKPRASGGLGDGRRQRRGRVEARARGGRSRRTVALANKECLVCAGDFFMQRAAKAGACILPADSEHNALFQALGSGNREELVRVIITASGAVPDLGQRRHRAGDAGAGAETSELEHGPEDHHRFRVDDEQGARGDRGLLSVRADADEIDVLVHPQSIIHGMVEFSDRSVVAQLGAPDMRIPIAHCLGWPDRIVGPAAKLDLAKIGQLTFEAPDFERFPALRLAYDALATGRGATTVTMPPTRWRWRRSSPARSDSARSRGWSRRR